MSKKQETTIAGEIKKNYKNNVPKLCGIIGDITISIFLALTFALNGALPIGVVATIVLFTVKPYIIYALQLIFKGDLERLTNDLIEEKKENSLMREIYEWKCLVAARDGKVPDAIVYNKGWNDINSKILGIEKQIEGLNNKSMSPTQLAEEQLKILNK